MSIHIWPLRPAVVTAVFALTCATGGAAAAAPLDGVTGAAPPLTTKYAIHVVKDLGGGAYWNVTTNSMYVVNVAGATLTETVIQASATASELLTATAQAGTEALLLVNGTVLVPAQEALGL